MTIISPSILSADFNQLGADCRMVLDAGAQMLHYDVMDGHFVPNISFGVPVLKSLHKGMPAAFYDVHLMISDPVRYAPDFAKAGANLITFHLEAVPDAVPETIAAIRAAGCQVGISIKPGTPAEAVYPYLDDLDLVLVMSVEPGFGGQKFMPSALDKLSALRAERDRRLDATTWLVERHKEQTAGNIDVSITGEDYAALLTYRQALRDLPQQEGFPWEGPDDPKCPWPDEIRFVAKKSD